MSMSKLELKVWEQFGKRYNKNNECLNCGESFYEPHQPTCVWSDDCDSLNRVICGDCLRTDCAGCI